MTESVEAITLKALSLALNASSLRQQAIAANIANSQTEGFRALQVDFESQLERARRDIGVGGRLNADSLEGVQPRIASDLASLGRNSLDVQMAEMAKNAVHHQALVRGVTRHLSIYAMAVGDGKK